MRRALEEKGSELLGSREGEDDDVSTNRGREGVREVDGVVLEDQRADEVCVQSGSAKQGMAGRLSLSRSACFMRACSSGCDDCDGTHRASSGSSGAIIGRSKSISILSIAGTGRRRDASSL